MTTEYLLEKRQGLIDELQSDEHYINTETFYYGTHDPFIVDIVDCDKCSNEPNITVLHDHKEKMKWQAKCRICDRKIIPQKYRWQAQIEWNWINLNLQNYRDLPMFGLARLEPKEAKNRMLGIRRDLEIRKKIAGLDRQLGSKAGIKKPTVQYQQKLEAYLKWSMLALRLIKNKKSVLNEER